VPHHAQAHGPGAAQGNDRCEPDRRIKATPHNIVSNALRIFSAAASSQNLAIHKVWLRFFDFPAAINLSQIDPAELCGAARKIKYTFQEDHFYETVS
jgi:hypothetical protein